MLRLKRFVFLLVAGLAMAFEGCAGFSPGKLETRPVLTVAPGSMAFLSQSGTMLTQNTDGTIGIPILGCWPLTLGGLSRRGKPIFGKTGTVY